MTFTKQQIPNCGWRVLAWGVVKARIAGTPDNPVIVDVQRYIINDGELGIELFLYYLCGE